MVVVAGLILLFEKIAQKVPKMISCCKPSRSRSQSHGRSVLDGSAKECFGLSPHKLAFSKLLGPCNRDAHSEHKGILTPTVHLLDAAIWLPNFRLPPDSNCSRPAKTFWHPWKEAGKLQFLL